MFDAEIRYCEVLQQLINARGSSRGTVERNLGWSRGLLTKLLQQKHKLRVEHVLSILGALAIDPLLFYSIVHPPPGKPADDLLHRVLNHLAQGASPQTPLPVSALITEEDLERRIEAAVRRELARLPSPE